MALPVCFGSRTMFTRYNFCKQVILNLPNCVVDYECENKKTKVFK